jgi:hypothetical protein
MHIYIQANIKKEAELTSPDAMYCMTSVARIGPFWREKIRGFCRKSAPPYFNVHEFTMLVRLWSYFPTNPRLTNWLWMRHIKQILRNFTNPDTLNMVKIPNEKHTRILQSLQLKFSLVDAFRVLYPNRREFSCSPRDCTKIIDPGSIFFWSAVP